MSDLPTPAFFIPKTFPAGAEVIGRLMVSLAEDGFSLVRIEDAEENWVIYGEEVELVDLTDEELYDQEEVQVEVERPRRAPAGVVPSKGAPNPTLPADLEAALAAAGQAQDGMTINTGPPQRPDPGINREQRRAAQRGRG